VTRAYQPRLSTLQLFAQVLALPRVNSARIVAPSRGAHPSPARIRIESNRIRYLSLDEARVLVARPTVTSAGGRPIIIAATGDFDAHGRPIMEEVRS
jgi:hypothetical protein